MAQSPRTPRDLTTFLDQTGGPSRVSEMAAGLVGSEILKIAGDIREMVRRGQSICNLTVGDFSPAQFPLPGRLLTGVREALEAGETNYPPSNGVLELREAVVRFYARELGLQYPLQSVLIAGGARPAIYGTYRAIVDPGDKVVYPVPSWNNNHYCHMLGAEGVPVKCGPHNRFLPTREAIVGALPQARLVCVNSPLNPTGTAITGEALEGVCRAILEENERREQQGRRPVFLMYDHIYWMLTVAGTDHVTPPGLLPEMAKYTVFVDGISKAFAATGIRVGWAVGPPDVINRMSAILGHVGAWAPRAEQVATIGLLDDPDAVADFHATFKSGVARRLKQLHAGFQGMAREGLPVESIPPMGAIYLTVRIHPFNRTTSDGQPLRTNEDVRRYLLQEANVGIVPFQAFGVPEDEGWFRLSVGAVSEQDIEEALPRIAAALGRLR